jgi:hypothetical protein
MTLADDLVTLINTYYGDVGGGVKPEYIINLARFKTDPPVPGSKEYIAVWIPPVTAEKELINEFYADVDNILRVRIATGTIERMTEIANEVRILINNNSIEGMSLQYTKNEADMTMRYDNLFVYEFDAILENNAIPIDAASDGWDFTPHTHLNLQFENGFENRVDSDISFVSGTRTFTIAPAVTAFAFWQDRIEYTKTASEDIIISDVAGIHILYYDSGTLTESVNPSHATMDDIILNKVWVATIYWNTTDDDDIVFGDERHGFLMSGATHHYLHDVFGTQYESGFGLSGYTLNTASDAALNFEVTDGDIYDEDVSHEIEDGDPSNQYEQQLSGGDAEIPVLYRDDVTGAWTEAAASALPYLTTGSGRLAYNKDDGDGTFSQVEVANNKYMTYTLVATNDTEYPIKMIQGQEQYDNKPAALEDGPNEILAFGDFPTPEMTILYRFIMQTGAFAGTKKAKIIEITDFRGNPIVGSAAAAQDHGSLGGLADDDHAHYALANGTRTFDHDELEDTTMTGAQLEESQMFGSANAAWVPCAFEGGVFHARYEFGVTGSIANTTGADPQYFYHVPLAPLKGSLKLYISGTRIGLSDADAANRVAQTILRGFTGTATSALDTDNTSKETIAEHEDTFTAVDCSGQDKVQVHLLTAVNLGNALDVDFVSVRCYYAA